LLASFMRSRDHEGKQFSRFACGFTPACGSNEGPSAKRYEAQG